MPDETPVPKRGVDKDDRRLLELLIRDGKLSHRALAQKAGLSLATVNRRIRRLESQKVIKSVRTLVDADALGWGMTAIIGVRIDKGHLRPVQQAVAKDPRVFAVYDVTGEWDGIVLARLRDRADLDDLAKTTLSATHIQRTNTMVVLATVLEESVVRVPA